MFFCQSFLTKLRSLGGVVSLFQVSVFLFAGCASIDSKITDGQTNHEEDSFEITFEKKKYVQTRIMDSGISKILTDLAVELAKILQQKLIEEIKKYTEANYSYYATTEHFYDPDAIFDQKPEVNIVGFDFIRHINHKRTHQKEMALAARFEIETSSDRSQFRVHLEDVFVNYSKKAALAITETPPPLDLTFTVSLFDVVEEDGEEKKAEVLGTCNLRVRGQKYETIKHDLNDLKPFGSGRFRDLDEPSYWFNLPQRHYKVKNDEVVFESGNLGVLVVVKEGSGF